MGNLYTYQCTNCGEEQPLFFGIGMVFPHTCSDVMGVIANGEYGPELKVAYEASAMPGVCAETKLYVCESCGRWEVLPDATLYEPLDVEAELSKDRWGRSAREARRIPYLMPDDLKRYRVIAAYSPTCECGAAMKESARIEGRRLACPKCGTMDDVTLAGMWD